MNSVMIFALMSLALVSAMFLFALPNPVQAKISFCADGAGIFQCFIKENDCNAFAENNDGTICIRSKT
jgi:hypothetical protein